MKENNRPVSGRVILGLAAAVGLAGFVSVWNGGVAMDLMNLAMQVFALFGPEVLPFRFDPVGASIRFTGLAVAVYIGWRTVRYRRAERGSCVRCGLGDRPARDWSRLGRRAAYLSILPAGGYAALKMHWALGGTIGVDSPSLMGEVNLWSPGFLDTAIMAVIGIGVAIAMTHRWCLPRLLLLAPALIGLAMLLPVTVWGNISNVISLFGSGEHALGLAPWTPWYVYACFTVWAACLLVVTVDYVTATVRTCRACGRRRASVHDGSDRITA